MKTSNYCNSEIKNIKAQMKAMNDILKGVKEDIIVLENARNNYTYDNAMAHNRERVYEMLSALNQMAQEVASIYNLHTSTCETWMNAETKYEIEHV